MRSHTGGEISMLLGATHYRSRNQKLNTKSSTESELVGESNYVPYNMCYIIFMHHQVYLNKSNKLFQDNQSAMRMDRNGRN